MSVDEVVRIVLFMSKASCAAWCWRWGQSAMACRWSSMGWVQFGHVASMCVPSAWVSPLLCLSCLVGNLFRITLVRKINRWSGSEDFDAVFSLAARVARVQ